MRTKYTAAGKVVKLKENLAPEMNGRDISGQKFVIEDWAENVFETSWHNLSNFAAMNYLSRVMISGFSDKYIHLPDDDDVLYGKINGFGFCIHRLEIDDSVLP